MSFQAKLLSLSKGGTGANLTASNGGIVYSTASAAAILSGTATAGQILRSGTSAAPSWSTSTYPATNAANTLLYASSANTMAALATANSAILATDGSGVPSITTASGNWLNTSRSCFLAKTTSNQVNVTGDGTVYTVNFETVSFDQGSNYNNATGTFTAPVTGKYMFSCGVSAFSTTATGTVALNISVNSVDFPLVFTLLLGGSICYSGTIICNMTAAQTATVNIATSGGAKTVGVTGSSLSYFSGMLLC